MALASDVVIQLGAGDAETASQRRDWQGIVYVPDPGTRPWRMTMQVMQSGVSAPTVSVNGTPLTPTAPPADGSGQWVTAAWTAPAVLLRLGPNEIRVALDSNQPAAPALQIKDIVLIR